MTYDIHKIRAQFPILDQKVYDLPLIYFDNAATTQKPLKVIEAINTYYKTFNANIHRGVHYLSQKGTDAYEEARESVANFINAQKDEVVFTSGTTESINLVSMTWGRRNLKQGDEVIITVSEHHSNIVPWQLLSSLTGFTIRVVPLKDGELDIDAYDHLLSEKTKLVAVGHISNALGTINPVKEMIEKAHKVGAKVLIDGAQAAPHLKIDVQDLDADFYCFSGHKMYGSTGIGVLYGKSELLSSMIPYQGGGEMIENVTFEKTTYKKAPHKFEAGTPNIAGAIGLKAAIDFIEGVGHEAIQAHEEELMTYATEQLQEIEGVKIVGNAQNKAGALSFLIGDTHPYDAGTLLDRMGIAVRTGNHCAEPLMTYLGVPGTIRASFALYNTKEEVDTLVAGIHKVKEMLG